MSANIINVPVQITPLITGFNRNIKVSDYLNLGELFDATKVLDKGTLYDTGINIDKRLLKIHTYLRELTGHALYVGSAGRSKDWELYRGRSGESEHVQLHAMDYNGIGLKTIIEKAVKEQNEVFLKLRRMGVNAFGLYDWGIHLDLRTSKSNGDFYFWDYQKKKVESTLIYLLGLLFGFTIIQLFLKLFKQKNSIF
jgi:hypothetical protein